VGATPAVPHDSASCSCKWISSTNFRLVRKVGPDSCSVRWQRGSAPGCFRHRARPATWRPGCASEILSRLGWTPLVARGSLHSLQCTVHSLVCSVPEHIDSSPVRTDPGIRLDSACPVSVHPSEQRAPGIARRHGVEVPGAPARTGAPEPPPPLARISLRRVARLATSGVRSSRGPDGSQGPSFSAGKGIQEPPDVAQRV
jgi:hypothetical protein